MVSVIVIVAKSTLATGLPGEAESKTLTLPELPSVGAPENESLSGGSGQVF
jgi:hypothetical protein